MREKLRTAFAERLLEARKRAGLSQPQLAKLTGVSQGTIGEAETTAIGSKHTAKLAGVLGVRPQWLSTGDGPMTEPVTWPFLRIDIARVLSLPPEDLAYLEGRLESALENLAAGSVKANPSARATKAVLPRFNSEIDIHTEPSGSGSKSGGVQADRHGKAPKTRGR